MLLDVWHSTGVGGQTLSVGGGAGQGFSDGAWHSVRLERAGPNTTLTVDSISDSVLCESEAGPSPATPPPRHNLSSTADLALYVGGLPSWYTTRLQVGTVAVKDDPSSD